MSQGGFVTKSAEPELITYEVLGLGASGAVSEVASTTSGVALSYVSAGRYRLTWPESPGIFCVALASLQATTPADVKNYSVVTGAYSTTAYTLDIYVYNASGTLTDLAALNWLNGTVKFKRTAVAG